MGERVSGGGESPERFFGALARFFFRRLLMPQPWRPAVTVCYRENWASGHMSGSAPAVDFETYIVVRADRFSNEDCSDVVFEGLSLTEDGTVSLEFLPPDGKYCRSFGFSHVVFVALEKASLPAQPFELQLGEGHGAITVPIGDL